jgi:hypothetical protein
VLDARFGTQAHADAVDRIFKQAFTQRPAPAAVDGRVSTVDAADDAAWPEIGPDALSTSEIDGRLTIASEAIRADLDRAQTPWTLAIETRARELESHEAQVHLAIAWHRVLLALDMVYVHAAAVAIDGRAYVFVGEKGAGKSTLTLALGRRGARVLSDDHVVLERAPDGYVVSGCEPRSRVTQDTEAFVFDRPLAITSEDFAGTMKKEFDLAAHFDADPHVPYPIAAVYFPIVGARLHASPLAARDAAIELLARTRKSFRPQHAGEIGQLLDVWTGFASSVPAFNLELPADLRQLDRLPALLRV